MGSAEKMSRSLGGLKLPAKKVCRPRQNIRFRAFALHSRSISNLQRFEVNPVDSIRSFRMTHEPPRS